MPDSQTTPDAEDDEREYAELLLHNYEYDRWESMTDTEREKEIKWAIR